MAEFTLKIKLGDAAMQTSDDIERAVCAAAKVVHLGGSGCIFDDNGNKVGYWNCDEFTPDSDDEDEDNGCDDCGASDMRNCTCDEDDELEPDTDSLEDHGIELGSYES